MRHAGLRGLAAAILILGAPAALASASESVIDFEGLSSGAIVSEIDSADGLGPIVIRGTNPHDPVPNSAVVLDSGSPGTANQDLGTPNRAFGGPGVGTGGATNGTARRNVLIVSGTLADADGDGRVDAPEGVGAAWGAALVVDFSLLPSPCNGVVRLKSMTVLDVDDDETGGTVCLYDANDQLIAMKAVPTTGDNGAATMAFGDGGLLGVSSMVISFAGSAAIDDIVFDCPGSTAFDCENGLETLTLRYTGHRSGVGVKVTDPSGRIVFGVFPATNPGDEFRVSAETGRLARLSPEIALQVYDCPELVETTTITVDCSRPIGIGFVYGSFEVVDLRDSAPRTYDSGKDHKIQDKHESLLWKLLRKVWASFGGSGGTAATPAPGDDGHAWWHDRICPGDHENPAGPPPDCDGEGAPCKGGLTDITLQYVGGRAGVRVEVADKDGDDLIQAFDGIDPGEQFLARYNPAVKKDKFPSEISVRVVDGGVPVSATRIHVSCSQPIAPGFVYGDFVVVAFTSRDEGTVTRDDAVECGWKRVPPGGDDPHDDCDGTFTPIDPIRVNVGGSEYTDSRGQAWSADFGYTGGEVFVNLPALVDRTDDPDIYRTERFGSELSYAFAVPPAKYEVTLHLAEIYFEHAGLREFSVEIEGETCIDGLDIVRDYWHNEALTLTCTVCVTDGTLDLRAWASVNNAKLSGIEIVQVGGCGCDEPPPDCEGDGAPCKGGLTDLTLEYQGGRSGVRVEVADKDGENLIQAFDGVDPGDQLAARYNPAVKKDKFPSEIAVRVIDGGTLVSSVRIHVSCSQPIAPGFVYGDFEVVAFTSRGAGPVPAAPAVDFPAIRLNAGGDDFIDAAGNLWIGDDDEDEGYAFRRGSLKIHDTVDEELYRSERYGSRFGYQFDVPNGLYEVHVRVAEIYFESPGARVFDIVCEGERRHASIDLLRQFGYAKEVDEIGRAHV